VIGSKEAQGLGTAEGGKGSKSAEEDARREDGEEEE
jgi:hypothetical protein